MSNYYAVFASTEFGSIASPLYTGQVDSRGTGFLAQISPIGDQMVTSQVRLVGSSFIGTTIDSTFWTAVASGAGAAVTQASGVATIESGTAAAGAASLTSVRKGRFMFAYPMKARIATRTQDTGIAGNVRRWLVGDGTDDIGFVLNGTDFGICYQKSGGGFTNLTSGFNGNLGTTYAWDTNIHALEIIYFTMGVWWFVDGELLHYILPTTATLVGNLTLNLRFLNTNTGNTTNVKTEIQNGTILRMGNIDQQPTYSHQNANGTYVLKRGAGMIHEVSINTKGGGSNTLTLYDNTAASGAVIAIIDTVNNIGTLHFHIAFSNGLTAVLASNTAADITITFD